MRASLLLAVSLAACSSPAPAPIEPAFARGPAADGALDCALQEASARGYVAASATPGVFVRAERAFRVSYNTHYDVLTASLADDDLTVQGTTERDYEGGRVRTFTSERVESHVGEVVAACARG